VQHLVTLTCGFYMGRTEVTQAQYLAVMGTSDSDPVPPGWGEDDLSRPVNRVTWANAVEFCRRLSELEGGGVHYRLPTEAEWEYACRAGTTTRYWFGDAFECIDWDRLGDLRHRECFRRCESVEDFEWWCHGAGNSRRPGALKRPNPWGLYDMCANVWEWCSDWYGEYPRGHVIDPTGPARGQRKVMRSGGYYGYPFGRSAQRLRGDDNGAGNGFRVVLDLPDCIRPSVPPQ
jgi:formylglycine-generating enzyme required for sulfatase activity